MTFGLGLHIPENELDLCRKLTAPAWISVSLQNDLWSWPKERDAAEQQGQTHVINALWVLMQEKQVDIDEAEKICRKLVKEYVAEYRQIWEENRSNESISPDLRKYMECMLYSISGNVVWSLGCPRYHSEYDFNEKQLDWMRNGLPQIESSADSSKAPSSDSSKDPATPDNETESAFTVPFLSPLDAEDVEQPCDADRLGQEVRRFHYVSVLIP